MDRVKSAQKYMSFSPTMTLAEYNQVKFAQQEQKNKLPDITIPQRVELPTYFNTPLREKASKPKNRSPSPYKKSTSLFFSCIE